MVNFIANHRSKQDGCAYAKPRKQYTRTKPIKTGFLKINPLPREKAAIIKLTAKFGYSINQLAQAFGRSTSYIQKIVRNEINLGFTSFLDKRKLPNTTRLRCSAIRKMMLQKYLPVWMAFILGEEDKPP
jgi:AraC-like DNA-binding protein